MNNRRMFLANTAGETAAPLATSQQASPSCQPVPPQAAAVAPAAASLPPVQSVEGGLLAAVAARSFPATGPTSIDRAAGAEPPRDDRPKSQRIGEAPTVGRDARNPAAARPAKRGTAGPRQPNDGRLKIDRRESFRYETPGVHLLLGWPNSAGALLQGSPHPDGSSRSDPPSLGRMVRHPALLLNFSQTGLQILVSHLPPGDRQLWIGADESQSGLWTPVLLRSLDPADDGRYAVRLSFVDACPYDLFKHAVLRPTGDREAVALRNGRNQG